MAHPAPRLEQTRPPDALDQRRLVNPTAALSRFHLERRPPSPDLAHLVENHWVIVWDLEGLPPWSQSVLPQPCANLVFEGERFVYHGVETRIVPRTLSAKGQIFGTKFWPGAGFLVGAPAWRWTNQARPFSDWLPELASVEEPFKSAPVAERQETVESLIRRTAATPDGTPLAEVRALLVMAEQRTDLLRVEDWCALGGVTVRQIQRWFRDCVGVSPKWVLRHYRIHEAAARIVRNEVQELTELAYQLGYSDQAHFARDFKAVVGQTPSRYAATCRAAAAT